MKKDFDFDKSFNQPPILENYNLFASDLPLQTAVEANGGFSGNNEKAASFGELLGRAETLELGNLANKNPPVLKTHDRFGNRLDLVEFHPAYRLCTKTHLKTPVFVQKSLFLCKLGRFCANLRFAQELKVRKNEVPSVLNF